MTVTRPERREKTAVYRLYDESDRLLYVGIAKDPNLRFSYHTREKVWWPLVARRSITWFDDRKAAAQAEVEAIEREAPVHNVSARPNPIIVSESAAVALSADDLNKYEWITASEVARRVVAQGIRKSCTRQRVMQLAQGDPQWPIPREQWRSLANMWLFPWQPVEEFFRNWTSKQGRRSDLVK